MALETNTLSAALAALIGGGEASSNPSTSLFIPLCNASGQITSRVSIADLATVAAGIPVPNSQSATLNPDVLYENQVVYLDGNNPNRPLDLKDTTNGCFIRVFEMAGKSRGIQIAYGVSSPPSMYVRSYLTSARTWGAWKKFAITT